MNIYEHSCFYNTSYLTTIAQACRSFSAVTIVVFGCLFLTSAVSADSKTMEPDLVVVKNGYSLVNHQPAAGYTPIEDYKLFDVGTFEIARNEVTVGDFALFVASTGHVSDSECELASIVMEEGKTYTWKDPGFEQTDNHPVVCVSWLDVQAYLAWLSKLTKKSYRLPSEEEWAAARFNGAVSVEAVDASFTTACINNISDIELALELSIKDRMSVYELKDDSLESLLSVLRESNRPACSDGYSFTAPVGSFPANNLGIYDLAGNVSEWVSDGPMILRNRSISDQFEDMHSKMGISYMNYPNRGIRGFELTAWTQYKSRQDLGFRIARSLPQ